MGGRFSCEEPFLARNCSVPTSDCLSRAAIVWKSPYRLCLHRPFVDNSLCGRLQARIVPVKYGSRFTQAAALHLSSSHLDHCLWGAPHPFHRAGLGTNLSSTLTGLWTRPLLPASLGSTVGRAGRQGPSKGAFIGRGSEQMINPTTFTCQKETHLPRRCPLPWREL